MSRNLRWTAFSILILAVSAGWIAFTSTSGVETTRGLVPAPQKGFLAPDFELQTVEGDTIRLSDLNGKAVVLNLWATWCPPCQAEMPAFKNAYQQYQSQGLEILAVNTLYQDDIQQVQRFVEDYELTFPVLLDRDREVSRQYNLTALPTTFFIDPSGVIQRVVFGGPIPEAMLLSEIETLLQLEAE